MTSHDPAIPQPTDAELNALIVEADDCYQRFAANATWQPKKLTVLGSFIKVSELASALLATKAQERSSNSGRIDMVHELCTAIHGNSWARPDPPAVVWQQLLNEVEDLAAERAELVTTKARLDTLQNADEVSFAFGERVSAVVDAARSVAAKYATPNDLDVLREAVDALARIGESPEQETTP